MEADLESIHVVFAKQRRLERDLGRVTDMASRQRSEKGLLMTISGTNDPLEGAVGTVTDEMSRKGYCNVQLEGRDRRVVSVRAENLCPLVSPEHHRPGVIQLLRRHSAMV